MSGHDPDHFRFSEGRNGIVPNDSPVDLSGREGAPREPDQCDIDYNVGWVDACESAAKIAEAMRPTGGRMWTDEQHACYEALTAVATAIRELKNVGD